MTAKPPSLRDDFARDPPYPPDYLFPQENWSGLGDLDDLRFLERKLRTEQLIPLSYVRLRERLGFALLTMDMQNRWKADYQQALKSNKQAMAAVRVAARQLADHRMLLLGALDTVCTLYPDPGVRPTERYALLAETDAGRAAIESALGGDVPITVSSSVAGIDTAALFAGARPASETPAPSFSGLSITQDAPRLTVDATKSAGDASQGIVPGRPQVGKREKEVEEKAQPARIEDAPNVLLMRREHALLLALLDWAARAESPRTGMEAWEIGEMSRRWDIDWKFLGAEARRGGVHALAYAAVVEIAQPWRLEEKRSELRPGLVAGWIIGAFGPQRAQAMLRNSPLRRF